MGQLATSVAGAAIGFAIGGPAGAQIGWAAGSIAGSILFQETIRNVQPRLQDLKVTTGEYGRPIPYVEGAMRVPGWVAWASERRAIDTTTTVDSKGGPKVENTTTTYEVDMLIILTSHRIAGVRRIWMDGELVWSRAAESDFSTVSASATFARRVTVYTGDEDQLPDPTYEAAVGVGNAPAYRERGSIFIEGLDLGSSGQIRNMTFEVYTAASSSTATETLADFTSGVPTVPGGVAFDLNQTDVHILESLTAATVRVIRWRQGEGAEQVASYAVTVDTTGGWSSIEATSDVSGIALGYTGQATPSVRWYQDGGDETVYLLPYNINASQVAAVYARRGTSVVIGNSSSGVSNTRRVYKFGAGGGSSILQSPILADPVDGLVIARDQVFCAMASGIAVLDLDDMSLVETIPYPGTSGRIFADDTEILCVWDSDGSLYRRVSGDWEVAFSGIPSDFSGNVAGQRLGYVSGVFMAVFNVNTGFQAKRLSAAWPAVTLGTVSLETAVENLHERAGMDLSDVDASALASKSIRGMAVTQISTTRTALESLMAAQFFQAVKDQGIRYVNRGGSPALTIPYDDLGTVEAGSDPGEPLEIVENNDIEIPAYVAVKYANAMDDYQEGLEYSDRLITESTETRVVEFAMAMTPTEARQLAQKIANDLQVSKASVGPLSVQRKYAALQPTDVILVEGRDGLTARMRIDKREEAAGLIKLEGVLDDASVATGTATTDTDYSGSFTITLPSRTNWDEMDIPLLRTADDGPSFEVAFGAAGANWRGAVYFGGDDDTSLQQLTAVSTETVTGTCLTALGAWSGGGGVQVTGFLDVQVDGELSSITYDQLMAGGNTAAISSSGRWEIIGFQYAELLSVTGSTRTYRLRNFLRYRRGTEGVTHAVGDRFVLMQTQGIRRIPMSLADLQRQRRYKAVSSGRSIDSAQSVAFSWTGEKLKPLSPSNVRGNRDAADLVITWARRTRHEDNWLLGSVPLGETTERYEVDILNGSTVVRTLSSTTQSVTYTAAQQTTDFGSPPASVSVRVYQLSDSIGRGYPAAATV
jgi:hypothetical protein